MTEKLADQGRNPVKQTGAEGRYLSLGAAELQRHWIGKENVVAPRNLPLSVAQRGMWIGAKIAPPGATFNLSEYSEILGEVDVPQLIAATKRVADEAETWRTQVVDTEAGPVQRIAPYNRWDVPFIDLSQQVDPRRQAEQWMLDDILRPVDPVVDPLWRCAVFKITDELYFWYHRSHHLVLDGFGAGLLTRRLAEIYNAYLAGRDAGPSPFHGLELQLEQERDYRASPRFLRDREYWLNQLADLPEVHSLARRPAAAGGGLLRSTARVPAGDYARLKALAADHGGSLPQVLIALLATYIHRMTGAEDLAFVMPVTARGNRALRQLPGMVANAVVIRLAFTAQTAMPELIPQVAKTVRNALRHQQYRYEELRKDLGMLSKGGQIARLGINIEPFDYDLGLGGHRCITHNLSNGTIDDLTFFAYDRGDNQGLRIDLDANPALYSQSELDQHRERLMLMIEHVLRRPTCPLGEIPLLDERERQRMLYQWNQTQRPLPQMDFVSCFEARVQANGSAPALHCQDETLSYEQLNRQANRVAHGLLARGLGPGDVVAVSLPRQPAMLAALLAVMKTGAAYLPLDPELPAQRRELILEDARATMLVSEDDESQGLTPQLSLAELALAEVGSEALREANPAVTGRLANRAYVIFTSGSTGRPKGVVVGHLGLMNFLEAMQSLLPLSSDDRVLALTTTSFDIAALELYLPLLQGAQIVLCDRQTARDPAALAHCIHDQNVTVMQATPSHWQALLPRHAKQLKDVRGVVGGEALSADLAQHMLALGQPILNVYGPTETTVWSTAMWIDPQEAVAPPIGRPIANTSVYVLDKARQPVPVGAIGELYIGGAGVAEGYLGRPELTAERFLNNPFAQGRLYRTGDLVRWREDGVLEYVGRDDFQIKLRGFRIEVGEVEQHLLRCEGIEQAVVALRPDPTGTPRLVAYLRLGAAQAVNERSWRQQLAVSLPDYMIPSVFVELDDFPLNVNGKLDRKALPEPQWLPARGRVAPRNDVERRIADIWQGVFGTESVGIHDDFFDLGGDSLMAAQMLGRLQEELACELPLAALFESATIAELAEQLDMGGAATDPLATLLPLRGGADHAPLFCVHPVVGLGWGYAGLASYLEAGRPLYALQSHGLQGDAALPGSIEAVAAAYLDEIRRVQPRGPYHLLGWSMGGAVVYEIARQLQAQGESLALLAMLDAYPFVQQAATRLDEAELAQYALAFLNLELDEGEPLPSNMAALSELLCRKYQILEIPAVAQRCRQDPQFLQRLGNVIENNLALLTHYVPGPLESDIIFFRAAHSADAGLGDLLHHQPEAWHGALKGKIHQHTVECDHQQMLDRSSLEVIGPTLRDFMAIPSLAEAGG